MPQWRELINEALYFRDQKKGQYTVLRRPIVNMSHIGGEKNPSVATRLYGNKSEHGVLHFEANHPTGGTAFQN